jgi:hypothetical protein
LQLPKTSLSVQALFAQRKKRAPQALQMLNVSRVPTTAVVLDSVTQVQGSALAILGLLGQIAVHTLYSKMRQRMYNGTSAVDGLQRSACWEAVGPTEPLATLQVIFVTRSGGQYCDDEATGD